MPHAPRHSNTPDQEAARVFESKLKRHVQENPECQWEYDWFRNTLKKSIRRSRVQIDEQVGKKAESGQPLCDKFMLELAQPVSYLDAGSPRSSLFVSHSPTLTSDSSPERDPPRVPQSIGDVSPERNTPFGLAGSTSDPSTTNSQTTVPGDFIPTATSNPGNPRFNPHIAIPGTPYDESALSSVAPTPKVPGAFLASAHSLLPDSSVEHSPATRPGIIPQSDVPEIVFVPGGPDMDTPTPRFEYPSPFDNGEMKMIPRVQPTTPHTSSEAGDHPMVLDSDARVGDLRRDSSIGQEAGDNPSAQAVAVGEEGSYPGMHDRAPGGGPTTDDHPISPAPARESVPSAPGPYRLPGSYHSLTPGITPGASVDNLPAQLPSSTPLVENPALKGSDTPISDAGLELDLFPRPPTLQVPTVRPPAQSAETTPKSPISPVVPGAYRHNQSLFDLASVLSGEQASRESVPALPSAPVSGTEPVQHVDVDQVSYSNVPPALGAIPAESTPLPTKDSPSPAPEPALHPVPRTIPASTLQVFTEPDSSGVTPTSESATPSPFSLIPGLGQFDIRNRIVGAPVVEDSDPRIE
ncbi:hypothetical protein FS749_015210 [Ceratobasidium sp. UAMH 11750]|nr:hypothetical protein FS749_015210 [Ceratobasidium sp. UAMH 11750]